MKYFAYGSNLQRNDLAKWCKKNNKSTLKLTNPEPFKLENYKLGFTRKSCTRQGGVADIISSQGDFCWGVVFDLNEEDLLVLDMKEGVKSEAYKRLQLSDDMITYDVVEKTNFIQPHQDYMDIIISGAIDHRLPQEWIDKLKSYKNCPKSLSS